MKKVKITGIKSMNYSTSGLSRYIGKVLEMDVDGNVIRPNCEGIIIKETFEGCYEYELFATKFDKSLLEDGCEITYTNGEKRIYLERFKSLYSSYGAQMTTLNGLDDNLVAKNNNNFVVHSIKLEDGTIYKREDFEKKEELERAKESVSKAKQLLAEAEAELAKINGGA